MKKQGMIVGGIVLLVLLLSGAAFVGGQLFRAQQRALSASSSQGLPRKLVTPAAGMPTSEPDGRGDVTHIADNSLFICDPNDTPSIRADGTVDESFPCTPEIEVVTNHDTVYIHDVTARQYREAKQPSPGQDMVMQQAIEPGNPSDIGTGTAVRVWGTLSGNRIIAQTLLYWNRSPRSAPKPGS